MGMPDQFLYPERFGTIPNPRILIPRYKFFPSQYAVPSHLETRKKIREKIMFQNWMYSYARLEQYTNESIEAVAQSADRLFQKLQDLDVYSLSISEYNQKYFGGYLNTLKGTLQRYCYLLLLSINNSSVPLDKFVFLDYGAGSGILSLLAKELNIGTVIYNDIYDVSCHDATVIAACIGNKADYYIQGDIDEVIKILDVHSLECDAIASYDVIEHIYDIEYFIQALPQIVKNNGRIVMETTANPLNPLINRNRIKIHKELEYSDRVEEFGHKQQDSLQSYLAIRKEIIRKHSSKLKEAEVNLLAKKTRGFIEKDIIDRVDKYIEIGEVPQELEHPTNTCDPYTGNWAEHLIKPKYYQNILNELNFKVIMLAGYYSYSNNLIIRSIKNILNLLISIFKQEKIALSSSYIVYATKK